MKPALDDIALKLRRAYSDGPVPPLREALEPTDGKGAYAVQAINTRHWVESGRRIVGRKVGLTSKAVQTQLGVDQPDHGVLFSDMAVPDGGFLDPARTIQPKVEAEVAIVLKRGLDNPYAELRDVMCAADYALAALEIVDSRIADWKITFADTIADNGSSAGFVLSTTPRSLDGLDLRTCGMVLQVNGAVASTGVGAACLGHPLNAAAWLARTLSAAGEPLRAGDVILTGALGPMVALKPGDVVHADIGGLGSASFSFRKP